MPLRAAEINFLSFVKILFMIVLRNEKGYFMNGETSEIIQMAWCDKTSFSDIRDLTGLSETDVIKLMKKHLKPSSFRLWRKRVQGRTSKSPKKKPIDYSHADCLV